jgi:hypothetical protein
MINYKLTKSITNIPLLELNNYCMMHDAELDLENNEIILEVIEYGNHNYEIR